MLFSNMRIGAAITGSHCTMGQVIPILESLKTEGATVFPILSPSVRDTDTRFWRAAEFRAALVAATGQQPWTELTEVEPIGPKKLLDILLIAPCTGNTLAKLANGISDTSVTLACKAHLRNARPVVLAISSNDALGSNAENLAKILNRKHFYIVPFAQDDPDSKPNSLISKIELIPETLLAALDGRQFEPVLI